MCFTRQALALVLSIGSQLIGCKAQDKPLRIPKDRVLAYDMKREATGPYIFPAGTYTAGLLWSQRVIHDSLVPYVRIQVKITGSTSHSEWKIRFTDLSGKPVPQKPYVVDALSKDGDIWSDVIPGRGGVVQVWADAPTTAPTVTVDTYAYPRKPAVAQSLHAHALQPIASAPLAIQQLGRSIARLKFMADFGEAFCSGFMVSDDLFLTNNHCIGSRLEVGSATIEFGYDTLTSTIDDYKVSSLELTSVPLDYSLLKISGAPGQKWGKLILLSTSTLPAANEKAADNVAQKTVAFVIIQHPDGEPKQVSIVQCSLNGAHKLGVSENTDFGHLCDTEGGSSGSPVVGLDSDEVVGLHHFGYADNDVDPVNQAVYMGLILSDISKRRPELMTGITIGSHN